MTTPVSVTGSKPEAVKALAKTWRKTAEQLAEQAWRFLRLMLFASVVPILDLIVEGSEFDPRTLFVTLVPVFEGIYRQFQPALSARKVDSAPGATIVPEQVGVVMTDVDGLTPVPEPVQTDNGPRPDDPEDQPLQDPNYIPPSDDIEEMDETFVASPDNDEPVEV